MDKDSQKPLGFRPKYTPLEPGRLLNAFAAASIYAFQTRQVWGLAATFKTYLNTNRWFLQSWVRGVRKSDLSAPPQRSANIKPVTLLTFTIYPELARVWYYYANLHVDKNLVEIMIVDCSGRLDPKKFPNARIIPFCNFSHARKLDFFTRYVISSPYIWLSDDDVMIVAGDAFGRAYQRISQDPGLAVISFAPRGWSFKIDGKAYPVMGTYNILFSREIFNQEALSFSPVQSLKPEIGRTQGYYDTSDYANEQLLLRGYEVEAFEGDGGQSTCGFVGASTILMNLLTSRDPQRELKNELSSKPEIASYHLVGLFCHLKIALLFQNIYQEKPDWAPLYSEEALRELACELPEQIKEKTYGLFERYEQHYRLLIGQVKGSRISG